MGNTQLKNLLPDREVHIEYRTHTPDWQDCLAGFCHWDGKTLQPLDGDSYSIDDIVESYEWDGDKNLTVWYRSRWISGSMTHD